MVSRVSFCPNMADLVRKDTHTCILGIYQNVICPVLCNLVRYEGVIESGIKIWLLKVALFFYPSLVRKHTPASVIHPRPSQDYRVRGSSLFDIFRMGVRCRVSWLDPSHGKIRFRSGGKTLTKHCPLNLNLRPNLTTTHEFWSILHQHPRFMMNIWPLQIFA